jgi:hypothetical protein
VKGRSFGPLLAKERAAELNSHLFSLGMPTLLPGCALGLLVQFGIKEEEYW